MPRIINRIINNKYVPYKVDTLVKNTTIPFDCYIKRHSDYVIIIEAGTYISEELFEKLQGNPTIYVLINDSEKIHQYRIDHKTDDPSQQLPLSLSEAVQAALDVSKTVSNTSLTAEERFLFLYTTTSKLMQAIFDNGDEKLPLNALNACIIECIECVNLETNIMVMLLKMVPEEYSTHHHSTNVAFFAVILAKSLQLSQEEMIDIGFAGLMHDIGKLRINQTLLLKPQRLEDDEYQTVKHHSEYGNMILKDNGITNQKVLHAVHFHHEKLDGSGYPKGLRGKLIPKYAKIIGVCDAFDALTTKRTFRNNYSSYEALLVMKQEMAFQFDELYIHSLIRLLR